jgi:hypothetical protein
MRIRNRRSLLFLVCAVSAAIVLSWVLFPHSSLSEEVSSPSSIDKERNEMLRDLESFERRLEVTRGCLERATTEAELRQCREEEKVRQFYEVIDKLSEIGMTPEERRMKRLERR